MPALLGYLVAVAVFFGSGYLGLAWLAAPDDTSTHQRSSDQSTSHSPNVSSKKPTASVADAKEAGVGTKAETTPEGNPVPPGKGLQDVAVASDSSGKVQKPDALPTGGCKPIGLTANGEMVFPLQCRELVERQRGPAASLPSVQTAPAPAQNEVQDSGTHKRNDKSDNAVIGAATQPGTSAERKLVEENDKTKPPNTSKSESNRKGADQAATSPNEVAPDDGLASSPAKRTGQRSAVDAKPKKAEKPRPGPEPERSKLVMMTLETIEFPDGHREQRLVPLKHSPRKAVQSDWYNPLGLR
jgi:hypothetical protein